MDADYRGEVKVVLFNHGQDDFTINKGDRIAQLVLERISMAKLREVRALNMTGRGNKGFGSTGRASTAGVVARFGLNLKTLPLTAAREDDDDITSNDSERSNSGAHGFCPPVLTAAGNHLLACPAQFEPATGQTVDIFEVYRQWIIDTGCGHDMISRRMGAAFREWLINVRPITFGTAGGAADADVGRRPCRLRMAARARASRSWSASGAWCGLRPSFLRPSLVWSLCTTSKTR